MEAVTGAGWYPGLNKVYAYIDDHLADDLSLAVLSSVSGYSEYHFHRVFHAMAGRTLHEYVQERRVVASAGRLLYEKCSITRIAYDCGFSSSAGFVRGFVRIMGCTPSEYRKSKERKRPLHIAREQFRQYQNNPELDSLFFIKTLEDVNVAGIACRGLSEEFESEDIFAAFQRLYAWLNIRHLIGPGLVLMGLTLDTPEAAPLDKCRYFACAESGAGAMPEGEVAVRSFPTRGKYICFTILRNTPDFTKTFFGLTDYLYGHRMIIDGLYPDSRPFVEYYRQAGKDIEITFCVPVRQ
jgi:AraC-like DNA-binding protein/DNA gyrase inhibitor GyrI